MSPNVISIIMPWHAVTHTLDFICADLLIASYRIVRQTDAMLLESCTACAVPPLTSTSSVHSLPCQNRHMSGFLHHGIDNSAQHCSTLRRDCHFRHVCARQCCHISRGDAEASTVAYNRSDIAIATVTPQTIRSTRLAVLT